jgi:DNA-binding LacI/PurR family transcriptional regulator
MVKPETRARVEAAAAALGYVPNRVARSLITGTSATIAIVVPQLVNSYFAEICQAARSSTAPLLASHPTIKVETE